LTSMSDECAFSQFVQSQSRSNSINMRSATSSKLRGSYAVGLQMLRPFGGLPLLVFLHKRVVSSGCQVDLLDAQQVVTRDVRPTALLTS